MIKVMARGCLFRLCVSGKKRQTLGWGNGAYVSVMCLVNAVLPVAVNRFVGNGILKLEVNNLEGE